MNKTTAALKLAEEALEYARSSSQNQEMWGYFNKALQGLYAIRAEALAEPEITTPDVCGEVCARAKLCYGCGKALDEANAKLADHSGDVNEMVAEPKCSDHPDAPHGFDRNASHNAGRYVCECEGWEPVKQEPVAWHEPNAYGNVTVYEKWAKENGWQPLYTTPPQHEWVDLTDDEIAALFQFDDYDFARAVIAVDREKNK